MQTTLGVTRLASMLPVFALLLGSWGCDGGRTARPMGTPGATSNENGADASSVVDAAPTAPIGKLSEAIDASSALTASGADAAPKAPAPVTRTGKSWPFHAWDRAEAVTFNQFKISENSQLYAYDEHGWTAHLVDRKVLDPAMSKEAVLLVTKTRGDVEVSKCPFPRHAVVLYEGDVPVASINICFQCGDILLWPHWEARPDWDKVTPSQMKAIEIKQNEQMKLYKAVFPRWQKFFRDDVGFPIDTRYP